ncbi:Collectin-46 [Bulinus truncatus]|nr:Collectin-46 [Bulinus truncatus]
MIILLVLSLVGSLTTQKFLIPCETPERAIRTYPWDKSPLSPMGYQLGYCYRRCDGETMVGLPHSECWNLECMKCFCKRPACEIYGTCCPDIAVPYLRDTANLTDVFRKEMPQIYKVGQLRSSFRQNDQHVNWSVYIRLPSVTGAFWTVAILAAVLDNTFLKTSQIEKMLHSLVLIALFGCIRKTFQIDCLGNIYSQLLKANQTVKMRIDNLDKLIAKHPQDTERLHYDDYNTYQFMTKTTVGGKSFLLSSHKVNNVYLADQVCAIYGGFLAEIEDFSEYTAAMDLVNKHFRFYKCVWVGVNDEAYDGKFVYTHSKRPAYTLWAAGEPNSGRKENCVAIYPTAVDSKGKMFDSPCEHYEPCQFICQLA